jgi:hypothetical protein
MPICPFWINRPKVEPIDPVNNNLPRPEIGNKTNDVNLRGDQPNGAGEYIIAICQSTIAF